jgi:amino-acid N-acetyltransferase
MNAMMLAAPSGVTLEGEWTVQGAVRVRRARGADAPAISDLVNGFAAEDVMLPRTTEEVLLAIDHYFVAVDERGHLLGCAALREYSPSLVELVSVAVAREAHGHSIGRRVVEAAERLARVRGYTELFAHTLTPEFFGALGYGVVERELYPEKRCRPHTACVRKVLVQTASASLAAAA